ncbi:MAG: hypothetical protein BGP16_12330 [Sphingobium sp. 66-54]|nr:MAG: hypothetical protein BGP16_12330 [Sphingobium sp. 66-54]
MTLLSRDTADFLGRLRANNDRQWFEAHRDEYEAHVKRPGEAFASALAGQLEAATGEPHEYRIFRIHRDVRFSKDKTPYNAHLHTTFSPDGGCKEGGPVWMFGLDPDGLTLGAGIFAFSTPRLDSWRALVAAPEGAWVAELIHRLRAEQVRVGEPGLKRVPAPHPADHPRADLLRRKGLTAWIDGLATETAFGAAGPANCTLELLRLRELFQVLRSL